MRALPLVLLAAVLAAAEPEADLRAAHAARSALEAEQRAWVAERERGIAARDALAAQAADDRARAASLAARAASSRDPAVGQRALAEARHRLEPLLQRAEAGLAALRAIAFPGTVPAGDAADALDAAERAEAQVAAGIERVHLDGGELTVRILRAGLRRGWWLSLDGRRAGIARVAGGALACREAGGPEAEAIRSLFAQFDGREPPHWTLAPLP